LSVVLADRTAAVSPPGTVHALLIPADESEPPALIDVEARSASISEALGGGLLADPLTGSTPGGDRYCFYRLGAAPEPRDNVRAVLLATRLGQLVRGDHTLHLQTRLRGTVIITGLRPRSDDDVDIPEYILKLLN
jgi:hypothetical protein